MIKNLLGLTALIGIILGIAYGIYKHDMSKLDPDVACAYKCEGSDMYEPREDGCYCYKVDGDSWTKAN